MKAPCWEALMSLFVIIFINVIPREVNRVYNSSDISANPLEEPVLFLIVFSMAPP